VTAELIIFIHSAYVIGKSLLPAVMDGTVQFGIPCLLTVYFLKNFIFTDLCIGSFLAGW